MISIMKSDSVYLKKREDISPPWWYGVQRRCCVLAFEIVNHPKFADWFKKAGIFKLLEDPIPLYSQKSSFYRVRFIFSDTVNICFAGKWAIWL